ncbi:MAG: PVC-type heme-binding CxxCH protein [Planctomycetota bacterium]
MSARSFVCLATLAITSFSFAAESATHKIVMLAGKRSHGYAAHEHYAGLRILQDSLLRSSDHLDVTVIKGWPEDTSVLEQADCIVMYSDGGRKHLAMDHRDELRRLLADGTGLVALHYAVEMLPGESGSDWVELLGGHFEIDYSVNPHWTAEFKSLPDHPVANGVEPFKANDEWYFHLRFSEDGKVTPILAAVAPPETMRRKDGHHSGNPHVRKSVAAGEMQTVAWAYDRPDGGRSFGFTGGHHHWNWGNEDFRRLVTNAIRWSAGESIEPTGSAMKTEPITVTRLMEDQDYGAPENFSKKAISQQYEILIDTKTATGDDQATNLTPEQLREPENALAGIEVAEGLELTLAASEPILKSLTNLDIDDRGRVWVCDVMNYRRNNDSRPEGDRILILEDTTGDGVMDKVKTFYQGRDIDSAMGLCVLGNDNGNEVIVSASPYIWKFIDEDGDDVVDKKVAMFTETGQPQHDHSAHSFFFGPDGKLYWNFGNTGGQVKDAEGKTVIDIHGRPVVDDGNPLFGGMPFRCDLDGSNFEVLAHNFRNNWETTVDSFGTLWQSDNDDDGNRGTRINFVMEQGNYGYRDEKTGALWREKRINLEKEIPLQHWHLNDPGVVPNLLQTGAGSPSGICTYEGRLLPNRYWDQIIHCDPGPNVVRAYPVQRAAAGYTATIEPLLTGVKDKWFRPADVCVAPDGSLFVTDWYDPGVGGHRQEDTQRGRLFRIAPPGVGYQVPRFDYSTVSGAITALRNPNLAVRYKAWMALHAMGKKAEPQLASLYADPNPRLKARALWLLGKIEGRGQHYVQQAIGDADPDIRITGIRLAKQLGLSVSESCGNLAGDDSAAVRRELATAIRYDKSSSMPAVWAELATQHDGGDRWYLEALGIGSDVRPDDCFEAWLAEVKQDWSTPAGRDIVWRTRAGKAAEMMVELIADESLPLQETDRYFRSLEFHTSDVRDRVLAELLPE